MIILLNLNEYIFGSLARPDLRLMSFKSKGFKGLKVFSCHLLYEITLRILWRSGQWGQNKQRLLPMFMILPHIPLRFQTIAFLTWLQKNVWLISIYVQMLKRLSYPLSWMEGLSGDKDEKENSLPSSAESPHPSSHSSSSVFSKVFSRLAVVVVIFLHVFHTKTVS